MRPSGQLRLTTVSAALGSQGLNAGTNVATAVAVAYLLGPGSFGSYVVAYAVVALLLAANRAVVGNLMLMHLPGLDDSRHREIAGAALGLAMWTGILGGALAVVASLAVPALLFFAPGIVAATVHDACRYLFLAEHRPERALVLDATWALVQIVTLAAWLLVGLPVSTAVVAGTWGLAALVGIAPFMLLSPVRPRPPRAWWRISSGCVGWLTATAITTQAEAFAVIYVVGGALGSVDVAGLRAIQLVTVQPTMVFLGAILAFAIPLFVRLPVDDPASANPRGSVRMMVRIAAVLQPMVLLLVLVIVARGTVLSWLLPKFVGFETLVLPLAILSVTYLMSVPGQALLLGTRRSRTLFWTLLARALLVTGATAVGVREGLLTAAWAQAAAGVLALVVVYSAIAAPPRSSGAGRLPLWNRTRIAARRVLYRALRVIPWPAVAWVNRQWTQPGSRTRRVLLRPLVRVLFYRALDVSSFAVPPLRRDRMVVAGSRMERTLYWYGEEGYEPAEAAWWRRLCGQAEQVLEIGANIGFYTVVGAGAAGAATRYTSVEANPEAAAVLRRNLAENRLDGVSVREVAVVTQTHLSEVELALPDQETHTVAPTGSWVPSVIERPTVHSRRGVRVPAAFAPPLLTDCDLIKMDIEGAEAALLEAAWPQVLDTRPILLVEVLRESTALPHVLCRLLDEGYAAFDVAEPLRPVVCLVREEDERISRDVLMVPHDKLDRVGWSTPTPRHSAHS